jgi:hypothetical protein
MEKMPDMLLSKADTAICYFLFLFLGSPVSFFSSPLFLSISPSDHMSP